MRPLLDGIELPQVQDITEDERRALAELKPPGMAGSVLQNLGRSPARFVVRGVASGPQASAFVDELQARFHAGAPVPFTADIVADAEIDVVQIEDLRLEELAGHPARFGYTLVLLEHIEPVVPAAAGALPLDADLLAEAADLVGGLTAGLEIVEQLSSVVRQLTEFNEALGRQGTSVLFPPA